jgi:hypothetical protein
MAGGQTASGNSERGRDENRGLFEFNRRTGYRLLRRGCPVEHLDLRLGELLHALIRYVRAEYPAAQNTGTVRELLALAPEELDARISASAQAGRVPENVLRTWCTLKGKRRDLARRMEAMA